MPRKAHSLEALREAWAAEGAALAAEMPTDRCAYGGFLTGGPGARSMASSFYTWNLHRRFGQDFRERWAP